MAGKSPFPGMDPYLEKHWRDIHSRLVIYSCDQLQGKLPGDLIARTEERILVQGDDEKAYGLYPDVRVVEYPAGEAGSAAVTSGGTAIAEPLVINLKSEPATETYIEIREVGTDNQVVTVIEFLSMSAKTPGKDQKLYRKKQKELARGKVSLVEINLLRAGKWVMVAPPSLVPRRGRTYYQACVRRGWRRNQAELYPLPLRQPLPAIPIPLRKRDADVHLELQPLIEQCYQNGRYHTIDYKTDPIPPLQGDDATWLNDVLKQAGTR